MSWNDPRSAADQPADPVYALALSVQALTEEIARLRRQFDQQGHRLGTVEQSLNIARADAALAVQEAQRPTDRADRALAYLLDQADAVVLSLEPNGQVVAHAVAEPFILDSKKGWHSPWVRTARSEVGERASGALVSLWAYVRSQRQDEFAADSAWPPTEDPIIAVRQIKSEDEMER